MFVDKAKLYIKAGNGGNGAVAFRREIYVPAVDQQVEMAVKVEM